MTDELPAVWWRCFSCAAAARACFDLLAGSQVGARKTTYGANVAHFKNALQRLS